MAKKWWWVRCGIYSTVTGRCKSRFFMARGDTNRIMYEAGWKRQTWSSWHPEFRVRVQHSKMVCPLHKCKHSASYTP